jgi:hypothetical protein
MPMIGEVVEQSASIGETPSPQRRALGFQSSLHHHTQREPHEARTAVLDALRSDHHAREDEVLGARGAYR